MFGLLFEWPLKAGFTVYESSNESSANSHEISCADPVGGIGGPDPPWKMTSYIGFYRD